MPCGSIPGGMLYPSMHCRWYPSMLAAGLQGCVPGLGAWSAGGVPGQGEVPDLGGACSGGGGCGLLLWPSGVVFWCGLLVWWPSD